MVIIKEISTNVLFISRYNLFSIRSFDPFCTLWNGCVCVHYPFVRWLLLWFNVALVNTSVYICICMHVPLQCEWMYFCKWIWMRGLLFTIGSFVFVFVFSFTRFLASLSIKLKPNIDNYQRFNHRLLRLFASLWPSCAFFVICFSILCPAVADCNTKAKIHEFRRRQLRFTVCAMPLNSLRNELKR